MIIVLQVPSQFRFSCRSSSQQVSGMFRLTKRICAQNPSMWVRPVQSLTNNTSLAHCLTLSRWCSNNVDHTEFSFLYKLQTLQCKHFSWCHTRGCDRAVASPEESYTASIYPTTAHPSCQVRVVTTWHMFKLFLIPYCLHRGMYRYAWDWRFKDATCVRTCRFNSIPTFASCLTTGLKLAQKNNKTARGWAAFHCSHYWHAGPFERIVKMFIC